MYHLCFGLWVNRASLGAIDSKRAFWLRSFSVLDEAHGSGCSHIDCLGLDPLVTHLAVRYVVRVLGADFADIVDFVAEGPRVVAVVDCGLARHIELVMRRLLRCRLNLRLAPVSVVEVSIFEEADALGAEVILVRLHRLESALILSLPREAPVARLEV